MRYFSDIRRHLVCYPYSVDNLHAMAKDLGILPCWFHASAKHPHYDIPKRRIKEIAAKTEVVSERTILMITKGAQPVDPSFLQSTP